MSDITPKVTYTRFCEFPYHMNTVKQDKPKQKPEVTDIKSEVDTMKTKLSNLEDTINKIHNLLLINSLNNRPPI